MADGLKMQVKRTTVSILAPLYRLYCCIFLTWTSKAADDLPRFTHVQVREVFSERFPVRVCETLLLVLIEKLDGLDHPGKHGPQPLIYAGLNPKTVGRSPM